MDKKDLETLMHSLGENYDNNEAEDLFNKIDKNKTGRISFDDFCKIMLSHSSIY